MTNDVLLTVKDLVIQARGEDGPKTLINGLNLTLKKGEVLG
jgi:ABC-type glutathione transport system ATPase component